MNDFAVPKWQIWFASTFGVFLFTMNFVIIFTETNMDDWRFVLIVVIVSIIYIAFIIASIIEPLTTLKKMTKAELEDHEYDRIIIEDDFTESFETTGNKSV